jgi:hypothetical protein
MIIECDKTEEQIVYISGHAMPLEQCEVCKGLGVAVKGGYEGRGT